MKRSILGKWSVFGTFLISLGASQLANAYPKEIISDEEVPVQIKPGAVRCFDAEYGFGARPGMFFIDKKDILDSSQRIRENFVLKLPERIICPNQSELDRISGLITVQRRVIRSAFVNRDRQMFILGAEMRLPITVRGSKISLEANQSWIEDNRPLGSDEPMLPLVNKYPVVAYPSSRDFGCQPRADGSAEYQLRFIGFSRDPFSNWRANVNQVSRIFPNASECEKERSDLLQKYPIDLLNRGIALKAQRKVEVTFRRVFDNDGTAACQETEIETVSSVIGGYEFIGSNTFPIRNVDMGHCMDHIL